MDDSKLNLAGMSAELKDTLNAYARSFSGHISFGDFNPLRLTPKKSYTARTEVPVFCQENPAGTLYALVFQFHDGTGDAGDNCTFKLDDLEIPGRFKPMKDPRKIFPRSKKGTHIEAFFPFFTAIDEKYFRHAVSLEEWTVDDPQNPKTIIKAGNLGLSPTQYVEALANESSEDMLRHTLPLFLTCGYQDGQRFGDPHAIYCAVPTPGAQVVGFLAVPEERDHAANGLQMFLARDGQLPE